MYIQCALPILALDHILSIVSSDLLNLPGRRNDGDHNTINLAISQESLLIATLTFSSFSYPAQHPLLQQESYQSSYQD